MSKKPTAKHVFNAHFVGPRISWSREQTQAKKRPYGPTKSADNGAKFQPKKVPRKRLESGQPALIHP